MENLFCRKIYIFLAVHLYIGNFRGWNVQNETEYQLVDTFNALHLKAKPKTSDCINESLTHKQPLAVCSFNVHAWMNY